MRALIVDEYEICRDGMKALLSDFDENCQFLEVANLDEVVSSILDQKLDLIVIDIDSPANDNWENLEKLESIVDEIPVVMLTNYQDSKLACEAFSLGVAGFITKQTKKDVVTFALQIVLAGGRYFSPELMAMNSSGNLNSQWDTKGRKPSFTLGAQRSKHSLSARQLEILILLSEGKSNKIIARDLEIATGTVKVHIASILKNLKAKNRTQAVSVASHLNILPIGIKGNLIS